MRNIFKQSVKCDEQAQMFIQLMEKTHDSYGLSTETLCSMLNCNPRRIRTMMELFNNFKYENVIPTFKISKSRTNVIGSKRLYRRIDINSAHRHNLLLQAELDMIEYIMKKHNTCKILGEVNTMNSMTIEELQSRANEIMEEK